MTPEMIDNVNKTLKEDLSAETSDVNTTPSV